MEEKYYASQIYEDRALLERLGYGIMDVESGSGVGFENIRSFTYLASPQQNPRFYRLQLHQLTGHYYPGDLARQLWHKLIEHKWNMSEEAGQDVGLEAATTDFFEKHSHEVIKQWSFNSEDIPPTRLNNRTEPSLGSLSNFSNKLIPSLSALLEAGFGLTDIVRVSLRQKLPAPQKPGQPKRLSETEAITPKHKKLRLSFRWLPILRLIRLAPATRDQYYVRLVATLTGYQSANEAQATHYWEQILEHKWYMSEREGQNIGIERAAVDYFQRLNLAERAEHGEQE
jgi:hypothetical protein